MVRDLAKRYNASFSFVNYPTKESTDYFSKLSYCVNQKVPDKFWQFNDMMFTGEKTQLDDPAYMSKALAGLGIDENLMRFCTSDPLTETTVQKQLNEIAKTRFYGTPTIFINGRPFVGPKSYRVYAIGLKGLFYWMQ